MSLSASASLPPTAEPTLKPKAEYSPLKLFFILFSLAMGGFAIGTTEFASMSMLPYFSPALGISESVGSHVISAYALGVVIGAPILAVFGARLSRRRMLIWLMLFFAVLNGLSGLSNNYHTMLVMRFLSGLPHGAYFGVTALVAAALVPPHKRAQTVAYAMLGLMVATVIGVPAATMLGQSLGWRSGFFLVAVLAFLSAALVWYFVPQDMPDKSADPWREIKGLNNRHIWLTLAISAIGFGGLFAIYTYIGSTLTQITGVDEQKVPLVYGIVGIGMTTGSLFISRLADKIGIKAAMYALLWSALWMAVYPFATGHFWLMCIVAFCIGNIGGLGSVLQTRLMDVARDSQMIAAALNHSAFNVANALGPFLAGTALQFGWGLPATGFVGCALSLGGLGLWALAVRAARKDGLPSG